MARLRVLTWRSLATAVAVVALAVFAIPTPAAAAVSGTGTQCHNGGGAPLTPVPCLNGTLGGVGSTAWTSGAANASNSHWTEGDFISYRATLSGVTAGSYTLRLRYVTVTSSKHALDYLGSFDATE